MKRCACFLLLIVLLGSLTVVGQERVSVFGGWQFTNVDLGGIGGFDRRNAPQGWNADLALKVANHTSIVADVSGAYKTLDGVVCAAVVGVSCKNPKLNAHNFLFGPRFSAKAGRVTPFAEALFGAARSSVRGTVSGANANANSNGFAMALGGGLDVSASRNVSVRLIKLDYMMNRVNFNSGTVVSDSNSWNHVRIATGIVFRF